MGDPSFLQWAAVVVPVGIAVLVSFLNLWANARVTAERDRSHERSLDGLRQSIDGLSNDNKQSLAGFGVRLGTMQDEVIRMQAGLGLGSEHGLYAEMRETRRLVEEVRAQQVVGQAANADRIGHIEARMASMESRP